MHNIIQHGQYLHPLASGAEEIGAKIRQARRRARLSQEDLARRVGVVAQTVSRWENGRSPVATHQLERISEATGQPLSFFVQDGNGPQNPSPDILAEIAAMRPLVERLSLLLERLLEREQPPDDPASS